MKAEVIEVEEKQKKDWYGDDCINPNRLIYLLNIKIKSNKSDKPEKIQYPIHQSIGPKSYTNEEFELNLYKKTYGNLPRRGDKLELKENEDGYLRIRYED